MPIRILVADDEPEMLRLLSLLLERRNYETIPADSSVAALDLAFKEPPDAILLDLMMPDMDGLEVCRRLRADSRTSALPILAITARIGWGSRAEAVRAGVDDFVTKPFDADDLFSRIESALAGRESQGDRLVAEIMQTTLVTLGCHLIWLLAVNREEQALETAAIVSAPQEALARDLIQRLRGDASPDVPPERLYPRLPLAGGPFAELLRSGAIVYDLGRVSGAGVVTAALAAVGIKTVSAIPILTRGQPIGLLLYDNPAGAPRTENGRLAALAANIAAAALTTHGLIDDLRRSEESARAERALRQMILDTMGDELIVLDAAGRIEFVNQRLLQHTGYADVELQGRPISVLIGGWERGAAGLPARTMSLESRLKSKNGETRPMQIISAPRPAGGGTILVLTDLSQYKRIQAELEEQNRRLGALIQASRAMTSLLDLTEVPGRILEEAAGVMDAEGGAILLLDEAARGLTFAAATGPGAERVRGTTLPLNAGVAGWVARTGQAAMVDETEQDSRFYREVDAQTGLSTRSLL
ncbi:MAG: response regulator, partial [Chloroflexi bacterium]|nr:response regulator [Chloroflexota bacterium]